MEVHRLAIHRYSLLLAVCTLFLVVAGASVTSLEAGLSVPDWPLSYGQVMPEMKGGIFYEHGHRMVATTVGFLTIILAVWLWRSDNRAWMRRLGFAALAAVCVQGLLGGLTVLYMLPKPVSISHACLAELFFSLICAIALFTSPSWRNGAQPVDPAGWFARGNRILVLPGAVLLQVALGAAFRHKALPLAWHVGGAALVTAVVVAVSMVLIMEYPRHAALKRAATALVTITLAQVFLGVAAYMSRVATADAPQPMPVMVGFTVAHVALGALTMATSVLTAILVYRHVRRERDSYAPASEMSYAR
ncbi:MAG: COX15/CtaA family protein [Bryobacteraceae bacterium]